MMPSNSRTRLVSLRLVVAAALGCSAMLVAPNSARAVKVRDVCRVKGQEENQLNGLGIVVGLPGTGDGADFAPAIRALAFSLQRMAGGLATDLNEFRRSKNAALVMVQAVVPAGGARQGDRIDCTISSVGSAKSLAGGVLLMTPMQGPFLPIQPHEAAAAPVFGFASGRLYLDDEGRGTVAKIAGGCQLEEEFRNEYYLPGATDEGVVTLVLNSSHAQFMVAQDVAMAISSVLPELKVNNLEARAVDSVNIEIPLPPDYTRPQDVVLFISKVLDVDVPEIRTEARVDINEAAGSIVVSGDVEIGPATITHRNIVIETGLNLPGGYFAPVDSAQVGGAKLKSLVEALNAVKLPTADMIEIIKGLERNGKLHGKLVVQ